MTKLVLSDTGISSFKRAGRSAASAFPSGSDNRSIRQDATELSFFIYTLEGSTKKITLLGINIVRTIN